MQRFFAHNIASLLTLSLALFAACDTATTNPNIPPIISPWPEPEPSPPELWTVTALAPMPTARLGLASCTVNGKIFAIGGYAEGGRLSTVEEYDVATDTWSTKADMPTARVWSACAVVGGKIYVIGGGLNTNWGGSVLASVEEYNPATNTWTTKASMPTARTSPAISVVSGRIYVIGGANRDYEAISTVEVYNPATDTWSTGTHMPVDAFRPFAGTVGGKIYVFRAQMTTEPFYFTAVFEYDPGTDTWTEKARRIDRWLLTTSVAHERIYAIGGLEWTGGFPPSSYPSRVVNSYNPRTDGWERRLESDSVRVWGAAASSVNDRIYLMGGSAGAADSPFPPLARLIELSVE